MIIYTAFIVKNIVGIDVLLIAMKWKSKYIILSSLTGWKGQL